MSLIIIIKILKFWQSTNSYKKHCAHNEKGIASTNIYNVVHVSRIAIDRDFSLYFHHLSILMR